MNLPEKGTVGIYKITSPSGKVYIGQSTCIAKRWRYYKYNNCKGQTKLLNSLVKHGSSFHTFEVLEVCNKSNLNFRERYWQEFYNVLDPEKGLNCTLVETNYKSKVLSDEGRAKISKANGGKNNPMYGRKGKLNPNFGKKFSEDRIEQMRQQQLGFKHTEDTKNKLKELFKDLSWSAEDVEKRSRTKKEKTLVLNTETGIYYMGYEEAGDTCGMKVPSLYRRLNNYAKNNTSFILCYNKNKVFL